MKKERHILFLILILYGLVSCEKVIELNLNSSSPQIVIQGNIFDHPGPYEVKISRSVNFDGSNIFPEVTDAKVSINDNVSQTEILSQSTAGTYVTSILKGIPGRTYTLSVILGSKTYTASSTMPYPVKVDTIYLGNSKFGNYMQTTIDFNDPPKTENYYRIIQFINEKQLEGFNVTNDNLGQGQRISYSLISFSEDNKLVSGDNVSIWLECIDKSVFEYFRTVSDESSISASPTNPKSNISNGALGYFNACSVRKKNLIVP